MARFLYECIADGVVSGAFAGVALAIVQGLAATVRDESFLTPFRFAASLMLGEGALLMGGPLTSLVVGVLVNLSLGAAFGAAYGVLNASFGYEPRHQRLRQTLIACLFALALWAFNYHVIARFLFPWFLASPPAFQVIVHVLGFGVPLGLFYAGAECRGPRLWDVYA